MRLRAPGWPWLLAHELRVSRRASKASMILGLVLLAILWPLLHIAGWVVMGDPQRLIGGPRIIGAGAVTWFVLLLGTGTAFAFSVVALFERGDFDLLLSSPIAPRTVFVVRGLGVAAQSMGIIALVWLPFANAAALRGHWQLLAAYPVLAAFALGTTAIAFSGTLALVRAFGTRRAKVMAQVMGAVLGALMFIVSQAFNLVPPAQQRAFVAWLKTDEAQAWVGADSILWWPARAVFGEPVPMLAVLVLGAGLFIVVTARLERLFLDGAREPGVEARPASSPRLASREFHTGLAWIVIMKELRLLWRDPKLISMSLLQVLYVVPLIFVGARRGLSLEAVAAAAILITSTLAGNFAWMTVSGEEAPDLVGSAPVSSEAVLWLKVAAAMIAPLAICVPLFVIFAMQSFAWLAIFAICATAALASAGVVQAWNARPGSPRDLKKRVQSGKFVNLLEFAGSAGWAGACFALMHGSWWSVAGMVAGVAAPGLSWLTRRVTGPA